MSYSYASEVAGAGVSLPDVKSWVYRNLRDKNYSVMQRSRVVAHGNCCHLIDVEFRVRPGGRTRVLREGQKNVHAFAIGTLMPFPRVPFHNVVKVSYNPYVCGSFFVESTGEIITHARRVWLIPSGVYAELVTHDTKITQ